MTMIDGFTIDATSFSDDPRPPEVVIRQFEQFVSNKPATRGFYNGSVSDKEDGLYLNPELMGLESHEQLPQLVEVVPLPGAQLGAADSTHRVMFSTATIRTGDTFTTTNIAVKEFDTQVDEPAGREYTNLVAARKLGFNTFLPLAIAKNGDRTYLITEKVDDVETMDNMDWSISPRDNERYDLVIVPNLRFIATNMADMQCKGLFQDDSQIKNYAKNKEGEFVVIDLEDALVTADVDEAARKIMEGHNVRQFWYTTAGSPLSDNGMNFLAEESYETVMEQYLTNFIDIYLGALSSGMDEQLRGRVDLTWLRSHLYEMF